jgi:hypothetical protein
MAIGPIVKASWSVPRALEQYLRAANRPVPPPIHGYMLVDTGASLTCIALDVAEQLQLTAVGVRKTYGSAGEHAPEIFAALLTVEIFDTLGLVTRVHSERQAAGIKDLHKHLNPDVIATGDNHPKRLIGLLGREFLRLGKMVYDGVAGTVEITLDMSVLAPQPLAPKIS